MERKAAFIAILTLLLTSTLALAFNVQPVKAEPGTIYIREDGSVYPPTAPIWTVDNVTYTLTDNIVGLVKASTSAIEVHRNNVVVNGAGYTVQGTAGSEGAGIWVRGRGNVTIKNTNIKGFGYGIVLNTINISISGNNITENNGIGIQVTSPGPISISGNNIAKNNGHGIWLILSSNISISGNSITGNRDSGINLYESSDYNRISSNNITGNRCGIAIASGFWPTPSNYNTIFGNNVAENDVGISFDVNCTNNVLKSNSFTNNSDNFWFAGEGAHTFINDADTSNTVNGKPVYWWINKRDATVPDDAGFVILANCTNITVKNLDLTRGGAEIILGYSSNNIIAGNHIANSMHGILLVCSSNNKIYHNFFNINSKPSISLGFSNAWDDGYPSGGNLWSIYNGTDANGDGIGDTPYVIDANNQDRYPLVAPVVWNYSTPIPIVLGGTTNWVSLSSNSTISTFKFNQPQRQISFKVTGADGTIGFCQVTIPNALLSGPYTILVNNSPPLILKETSNGTHTSLYFTYSHSTKTVEIRGTGIGVAPQFPSATILLLLVILVILTSVVAVLVKRKFPRRPKTESVG